MVPIPVVDDKTGHVTTTTTITTMAISNMGQIRSQHHHRAGTLQVGSRLRQDKLGLALGYRRRHRRVHMAVTTNSLTSSPQASTVTRGATRHPHLRRATADIMDGINMAGVAAANGSMTKAGAEAVAAIEVEEVTGDKILVAK